MDDGSDGPPQGEDGSRMLCTLLFALLKKNQICAVFAPIGRRAPHLLPGPIRRILAVRLWVGCRRNEGVSSMYDIPTGPLSGPIFSFGVALAPLEGIPVIGILFYLFDYMLGIIALTIGNFGLK